MTLRHVLSRQRRRDEDLPPTAICSTEREQRLTIEYVNGTAAKMNMTFNPLHRRKLFKNIGEFDHQNRQMSFKPRVLTTNIEDKKRKDESHHKGLSLKKRLLVADYVEMYMQQMDYD